MRTIKDTAVKPIIGMDQRIYPDKYTAAEIKMFHIDDNGGWKNDVGWEPLIPTDTSEVITTSNLESTFSPTRFLAIWSRHQGAEQYYLYERNGILQYDYGNKGTASTRNVQLDTNRLIPKADDPGTQMVTYGRFSLFLNGNNQPIKFWGRELVEPFSWYSLPPRPNLLTPYPDAVETGGASHLLEAGYSAVAFDKDSYHGVGNSANGSINTYSWRVAFLSKTGSISPYSEAVSTSWRITKTAQEFKFCVPLIDIPIGPEGTVARIIVRTKNKGNGLSSSLDSFYEVARINDNCTINWIDFIPDSELDSVAVNLFDSAPIDHSYKYGTVWDNSIWLAGGTTHPTKLIYSKQGLPEQFPTFNYIDVGVRQGGHITQIFPYYNSLLVFREKSIDIITKTSTGYQSSTLDPLVGTTASNTIRFVPEVGVCFLSKDGVYAVSGGLYGGSKYEAKNISPMLSEEFERLTLSALPRATATYSDREKEYWVHYPTDGQTDNNRGAVFHIFTKGWSLRNTDDYELGELRFTQLATDIQGYIIIGTKPIWDTKNTSDSWPGIGLQVWSRTNKWGEKYTFTSTVNDNNTYAISNNTKGSSTFTSIWEDEGNLDIKKSVAYIKIEGLSQGNNSVPLTWYQDGSINGSSATAQSTQQSDYYNTTSAQTVFAPSSIKPVAVWNTSKWEKAKRIIMRYDIGATQASCFKFSIVTANYIHILNYRLGLESTQMNSMSNNG